MHIKGIEGKEEISSLFPCLLRWTTRRLGVEHDSQQRGHHWQSVPMAAIKREVPLRDRKGTHWGHSSEGQSRAEQRTEVAWVPQKPALPPKFSRLSQPRRKNSKRTRCRLWDECPLVVEGGEEWLSIRAKNLLPSRGCRCGAQSLKSPFLAASNFLSEQEAGGFGSHKGTSGLH